MKPVPETVGLDFALFSLYRGKGDYFRLGHGTDAHVRKPQLVEALKGKKIVHVSVGALHCLAVTDTGQVSLPFIPRYATKVLWFSRAF